MQEGSQGFRPYSARRPKAGSEAAAGTGEQESERATTGTTATHISSSLLAASAAGVGPTPHAPLHLAADIDVHDRSRSISSAPRGLGGPVAALVGLNQFTAGFPPGPQQGLLAQLPWFAQAQHASQQAAPSMPMDVVSAAAISQSRVRSSSIPTDMQGRLLSLSSAQPSSSCARPRRKSTLTLSTEDFDASQYSGEDDMDGALGTGRFDSLGAAAEEAAAAEGDGDGDEDAEDRTRRRLAQNREAARKSRQRRKAYVTRLEAEVKHLRAQVAAAAKGASGSVGGGLPARSPSAAGARVATSPTKGSIRGTSAAQVPVNGSSMAGRNASLSRLSHPVGSSADGAGPIAAAAELDMLGDLIPPEGHREVLAAFARWRSEHAATAQAVRQALDAGQGAEAQLRALTDEARSQLWGLFQMKRAVVYSEGVALIAGLAHLPPAERPFAWLGTGPLRPSDAAAGLLARLPASAGGRPAMQLQILKESLAQQEVMLTAGYDAVTADLRSRAARAEGPPLLNPAGAGAAAAASPWASPEVLGRLDALRTLLLQADGLWQQFLEETLRVLPLPQAALAAITMAEASAQLQALHGPWQALAVQQQAAAAAAAVAATRL